MRRHDEDYLAVCEFTAKRFSTCSRRQYCALIVGPDGRLAGFGYNGSPPGFGHCVDGACPRAQAAVEHGSSYGNCIAVHAEANALLYSDRAARQQGTLYVNGPPCWECARLIAGSGLARVVCYADEAYADFTKVELFLNAVNVMVEVADKP